MKITEGLNAIRKHFPRADVGIPAYDPRWKTLMDRLHNLGMKRPPETLRELVVEMDQLNLSVRDGIFITLG